MNEILAALGIQKAAVIAGLIGGTLSLRFFEGLSTGGRWATAAGGAASANYLAVPMIGYFGLSPSYEAGIGFLIGLFGMSLSAALVKVVKDTDWSAIIKGKLS